MPTREERRAARAARRAARPERLRMLPPHVDFAALASAALAGDVVEVERILDEDVFEFDGRNSGALETISDLLIDLTAPLVIGAVKAAK